MLFGEWVIMLLVTGATGFLGHHLVSRLIEKGYPVRALARPESNTTFLEQLGVEIARVPDITNTAAVCEACRGCRSVIHAAAHFRMWGHLPHFWQTNVEGTATMLAAAESAGVEGFVYVSTIAVVGRPIPGRIIDENHPCRPQDFYQRTKREAEHLVLAFQRRRGLPTVVVRAGALYGPWGRYAFNRLFFEEPLRSWRIKVNQGRHITFPAYCPDVAQGIVAALERGRPGEIYNLSGESLTHETINNIVSDLAGISRWRFNFPTPAVLALAHAWTAISRFTKHEPFYPRNLAYYVFQDWPVNSAKAQAEIGFQTTPFTVGAQTTLDWYREQGVLKR